MFVVLAVIVSVHSVHTMNTEQHQAAVNLSTTNRLSHKPTHRQLENCIHIHIYNVLLFVNPKGNTNFRGDLRQFICPQSVTHHNNNRFGLLHRIKQKIIEDTKIQETDKHKNIQKCAKESPMRISSGKNL